MSALVSAPALTSRVLRAGLLAAAVLTPGCSKAPTGPNPTISGRVVLAAGQVGDVNLSAVQLFTGNPFAPGATPGRIVIASGSASDAAFTFGDVGHGDFYVVAWKDDGDTVLDPGDLRGWYNGDVDGTGMPVAAVIRLVHGQDANIIISVAPMPSPQSGPRAGAMQRRPPHIRPTGRRPGGIS